MNFAQIMCAEIKEHYISIRTKVRNVVVMIQTVIATLTKVPEGAGRIALGSLICVRNIN